MLKHFYKRIKRYMVPLNKGPGEKSYLKNESSFLPTKNLQERVKQIKDTFAPSDDLIIRDITFGSELQINGTLIYIDGLVDKSILNNSILRPLLIESREVKPSKGYTRENIYRRLHREILTTNEIEETNQISLVIDKILTGETALIIEGQEQMMIFGDTRGWKDREIIDPENETVLRGPREGLTESFRDNTALIRRRIKDPRLFFDSMKIGKITRTEVSLVYIKGLANDKIVKEARQRLQRIDIDGILESAYLEEFIEDCPWSLFPQIEHTERPDKAAAALLEGRIIIITDNTPFVLILPITFFQFMQAAEDYYDRPFIGATLLRWLRLFAVNVSLIFPAFYVAITTFHQEMIPGPLLISLAATREGVPFPLVVEVLGLEFSFEVLREAGVKLPRPLGQALSIVGALILGDAAIRAGLVSPAIVIVVAMTAITSFVIPAFSMGYALRLLRFPLALLGASLGLYGVMLGLLGILIHVTSLRSFGVPYLAPLAPRHLEDAKDIFIRLPHRLIQKRPWIARSYDLIRREPVDMDKKPDPGKKG